MQLFLYTNRRTSEATDSVPMLDRVIVERWRCANASGLRYVLVQSKPEEITHMKRYRKREAERRLNTERKRSEGI